MGGIALNLNLFSFRAVKNHMNLIKKNLIIFIFSLSFSVIMPVLAADTSPLDGLNETAKNVPAYASQTNENARTTVINRVGSIVGLILSFVGIIFLVLTIYAGLMWMTAMGNSAQVDKAKDLLINAFIGLIIVTIAYSITSFVGTNLVK